MACTVEECQICLTEDNYWNMSKCKCLLEVEEENHKNKLTT